MHQSELPKLLARKRERYKRYLKYIRPRISMKARPTNHIGKFLLLDLPTSRFLCRILPGQFQRKEHLWTDWARIHPKFLLCYFGKSNGLSLLTWNLPIFVFKHGSLECANKFSLLMYSRLVNLNSTTSSSKLLRLGWRHPLFPNPSRLAFLFGDHLPPAGLKY